MDIFLATKNNFVSVAVDYDKFVTERFKQVAITQITTQFQY